MTDYKNGIKKLLQKCFSDKSIDVIFMSCNNLSPHKDYMIIDPETKYYIGYILTNGIKIPFIAEVWHNNTTRIYLDPRKNFYLALFIGDLNV
ncbi:hypothetical protein SIRV1gp15 [Sulfolobus islandicus rod-shaped virus 1]|uniref:Uncharacterized protein 91 n=1 Tax=Sulfolobus islandicus rod-shaped virus 1 TaxID=157898 RepID=Y91_SIRV1|nr:hypothetical protein SIRV1gp15 [Sulfolobus islandicus rod-shaped virus 1]Q8QL39.1 RecName: Full=Uncharacterized protein 91 [Sulfolobus islandicus rod-shaped virus 1]CAC93970.1 hypothetical protein [Sulfolobus islandicus rod-shaped virus 1]